MKQIFKYRLGFGLSALLLLAGCADQQEEVDPFLMMTPRSANQTEQAQIDQLLSDAQQKIQAGDGYEAIDDYEAIWEKYPYSKEAPQALHRAAKIRLENKQFADAFACYDKILSRYPSYPQFDAVVRDEFEMASSLMSGERPKYFGVIPGFRSDSQMIEYFEGIVKKAPFTAYAPLALMNIALIHEQNKDYTDSIQSLERLINEYPKSSLLPEAYLKVGEMYTNLVQGPYYDQGATKSAIAAYQDFLNLFPSHPEAKRAEKGRADMKNLLASSKLIMGNLYRDRFQNNKAAIVCYNEAIEASPYSESSEQARAKLAEIQSGIPSPGTPIDFLFSKKEQSLQEFQEDAYVEALHTDMFEPLQNDGLLDTPSEVLREAEPLTEVLKEPNPLLAVPEEKGFSHEQPIQEPMDDGESLASPDFPMTPVGDAQKADLFKKDPLEAIDDDERSELK
jgi:outer membrane protein assembly factor BamD